VNTGQLYLYRLDLNEAICLENRGKFKNISLSRRMTVCCVEVITKDLLWQLYETVNTFPYFSIALDDSTDTSDSSLVFIQSVNNSQIITFHEGCERQTN
jgi:hypothetical protein